MSYKPHKPIEIAAIARTCCWAARHPMQYGSDATVGDAVQNARDMGFEVTAELYNAIETHIKQWQPLFLNRATTGE